MTEERSPDPIDIEVGQRVRAFRLAKKLSQKGLADACGISFQQVQKYERGANRVSASMMCRIGEALGIDPADLLPPTARKLTADPIDLTALQSKESQEVMRILSSLSPKARRAAIAMLRLVVAGDQERSELER
jgi:Predicted transcriptional regulators